MTVTPNLDKSRPVRKSCSESVSALTARSTEAKSCVRRSGVGTTSGTSFVCMK